MSVINVSLSQSHSFSKPSAPSITLLSNHGVQGDAHAGPTVQHRALQQTTPTSVNLRQVHLMHNEILQQVGKNPATGARDLTLRPGQLGENITTQGIDLLSLPTGTRLRFVEGGRNGGGESPMIRLTGLRNPGPGIEAIQKGLKDRFVVKNGQGQVTNYLAGVMSVVETGGQIRPGMKIVVEKPATHLPLKCV